MTTRSGKKYKKSDDSNGSDNSKEVYAYMEGDHVPETVTHANVKDAVRRLPHAAFEDRRRLREVVLPEGLEEIETCVFKNCTALEHLHLPSTVTQIRNFAFQNCSSLRSVTFAEGNLRAVGTRVFAGSAIECIVLPSSVTEVGTHAFSDCNSLRELHLYPCIIDAVRGRHIALQHERGHPWATVHLRGGPVHRIPSRPQVPWSILSPPCVPSLYSRVSIPPRALVVTHIGENEDSESECSLCSTRDRDTGLCSIRDRWAGIGEVERVRGSFEFSRSPGRTMTHSEFAQVFIDSEVLNSLISSEMHVLKTNIVEILGSDISEDWPNKRDRLTELLRQHEMRHKRKVTAILELAFRNAALQRAQLVPANQTATRTPCLQMCCSVDVVGSVMCFL